MENIKLITRPSTITSNDGPATLYKVTNPNTGKSVLVLSPDRDGERGARDQAGCVLSGTKDAVVEHAGPLLIRGWGKDDWNRTPEPFDPTELMPGALFTFEYSGALVTLMRMRTGAVVVKLDTKGGYCTDEPGVMWDDDDITPNPHDRGEFAPIKGAIEIAPAI